MMSKAMTTCVRNVLEAAADVLEHPAHWTKGEMARNAYGEPVAVDALDAERWCAVGALTAAADGLGYSYTVVTHARDAVRNITGHRPLEWNEAPWEPVPPRRGRQAVVDAFRETAAAL